MTTTNELRQMYVDYFVARDHAYVSSSPIVPPDDPTMLFTSAGMVQFKPLYGGQVEPLPYTRAVTVQKCLRAGGKGSDLENVGKTLRHHTFFEMLGNFSFGDYFKLEALEWGWDFIWNQMKLPKDRLWATYFEEDEETAKLLEHEIGIPRDRIIALDAKENFWGPAGDTGACGPCSEVCFFTGTAEELEIAKKQDTDTIARRIVEEGDLFLEIWNMVFPQFDQRKDGSRPQLKYRGIDTGAGLERMTTAMNFVETGGAICTPYETDLLSPIVNETAKLVGKEYKPLVDSDPNYDPNHRFWINAIADHARALTFALSEGLVPSNAGRGYVLRRILRRALRFGYLMGVDEPFVHGLTGAVAEAMRGAYPELEKSVPHVSRIIRLEEEQFLRTVAQGSRILDEKLAQARDAKRNVLSGKDAFLLHSTYGFPVDMTEEIAQDAGLELDRAGYAEAMKGHQDEARKSWKGAVAGGEADLLGDIAEQAGETCFCGYEALECESRVYAIIRGGERVEQIAEGEEATVVIDATAFYAESGGQVGDAGRLEAGENGENIRAAFVVGDTAKTANGLYLHRGRMESGQIKVGARLRCRVDAERRLAIARNHTVTHLLQSALKQVLGDGVTQSGSHVAPDAMRFDFSHTQACTSEELARVERIVNEAILADFPVRTDETTLEESRKMGAIAPFGEKYGHHVRVVRVGEVSIELCGGTHLERSGRIGSFRIVSESSVAAGIRRIEGATGLGAYERWSATRAAAAGLSRALAVQEDALGERVEAMQAEIKRLKRDIKKLKQSGGGASGVTADSLLAGAVERGGVKIVSARVDDVDAGQLRALADQIRDKSPATVIFLGTAAGAEKALLICAVTKDITGRVRAGDVIRQAAPIVGGGGGGRPDLAQAGGKSPEKLDEAVAAVVGIVEGLLGA